MEKKRILKNLSNADPPLITEFPLPPDDATILSAYAKESHFLGFRVPFLTDEDFGVGSSDMPQKPVCREFPQWRNSGLSKEIEKARSHFSDSQDLVNKIRMKWRKIKRRAF